MLFFLFKWLISKLCIFLLYFVLLDWKISEAHRYINDTCSIVPFGQTSRKSIILPYSFKKKCCRLIKRDYLQLFAFVFIFGCQISTQFIIQTFYYSPIILRYIIYFLTNSSARALLMKEVTHFLSLSLPTFIVLLLSYKLSSLLYGKDDPISQ